MPLQIRKIQVWYGEIPDEPGMAAAALERLANAGANLEFVFTRPVAGRPDCSSVFLAPITEPAHREAAKQAGLKPARDVAMLCVECDDRVGVGYQIMSQLAIAGINLRGLSMSTVGRRVAAYLAFDNADVAQQAIQVLATLEV